MLLLIVALIGMFQVKDAVLSQMGASSGSDPTEAYICDRLLQSLSVLSACSNEQMREDYHVVLTALAPDPKDRMLEPVAKRLGITRYTHPQDPFVQSRERRAVIDAMMETVIGHGLKVGQDVVCKHGSGVLKSFDEETGHCEVELNIDGVQQVIAYESTGKRARADRSKPGRGGGEVRHKPVSFRPTRRARATRALSDATRKLVTEFYTARCATSPCARDHVRKKIGPNVYITAPLLILLSTYRELYSDFCTEHTGLRVSLSQFHALRPWNLRKCKHQCCLCRICENYDLYHAGLKEVCKHVRASLEDDDDESEDDAEPMVDWRKQKLLELGELDHKSEHMKAVLHSSHQWCLNQSCTTARCGFRHIWSGQGGLRNTAVNPFTTSGAARADPLWSVKIKWQRYSMVQRDAHHTSKVHDDDDDDDYNGAGSDSRAAERLDIEDRTGHV